MNDQDETRSAPDPPTASHNGGRADTDTREATSDPADPQAAIGTFAQTFGAAASSARNSGPAAVTRYELLGELGRGAMGVVHRARDRDLNREVALKMILSADAGRLTVARFWAEAEVMAAVKHPNVVQVYELGEHDGRPFMAMELVPGRSLDKRLEQGSLAPRDAVELVEKIARGVGAAHDSGVIHRDLKPANVLLATDGTPKVADFGLAKRLSHDLTQTKVLMGSPAYMAPEQAAERAKFVGPPADVWALGVILYECVAGARPFAGDTVEVLLAQIRVAEPPRLRARLRSVPRDLDTVVAKCLSKEPSHRYATATDLADDLARLRAGEPIAARPPGPVKRLARWARRHPTWATAAAAVLALTASLAVAYAREREAKETIRQQRDDTDRMIEELVTVAGEDESLKASDGTAAARRELLTVGLNYYRARLTRGPHDRKESVRQGEIHLRIGLIHSGLDEWGRAIEEYDAARRLFGAAVAADPNDRAARAGLATALNRAGNDHQHEWREAGCPRPPAPRGESFAKADECYALSIREWEALAADPGATDDERIELAKARGNRANLLTAADPADAAGRALFVAAIDGLSPLVEARRPALGERSKVQFNFGRALHAADAKTGEAELLAARDGFAALVALDGGRPRNGELIGVLETLADWNQSTDPERALQFLDSALSRSRELVGRYYGVLDYRLRLATLHTRRAKVHDALGARCDERGDVEAARAHDRKMVLDLRAAQDEAGIVLRSRPADASARAIALKAAFDLMPVLVRTDRRFSEAADQVERVLPAFDPKAAREWKLRQLLYRGCAGQVKDAGEVTAVLPKPPDGTAVESGLAAAALWVVAVQMRRAVPDDPEVLKRFAEARSYWERARKDRDAFDKALEELRGVEFPPLNDLLESPAPPE